MGYYPWSYWPGPYFGYYDYPYYPDYGCDDPYGPYPCYPYGYDPYSYSPYVSDPGDPPAASASTPYDDPPPARQAFVADGRWHRFGANAEPVAAYAKVAASRSSGPRLTRAAYAGDGKWHHFSGGGNVTAANHNHAEVAAARNSSPARVALPAHFQTGPASGK